MPKTKQVKAASQCGRWRGPSKDERSLSFAFEFSALGICVGIRIIAGPSGRRVNVKSPANICTSHLRPTNDAISQFQAHLSGTCLGWPGVGDISGAKIARGYT